MTTKNTILVYSQDDCIACDRTKKFLDGKNIAYEIVDMTNNDEARTLVKDLGFMAAPVVIVNNGEKKWAGYQREKLIALV